MIPFGVTGFGLPWEKTDQIRRWCGWSMDALGFGPIESPYKIAWAGPVLTLRDYGPEETSGPVLLIIPAPIKRGYLWDMAPGVSVVEKCLRKNLRVFMAYWEAPSPHEQGLGLANYASAMLTDCLEAIAAATSQRRVFLAGHSLGGTLAAIFTARHPERVQGLLLLESPLHFDPATGALEQLATLSPTVRPSAAIQGNVAGSFLDLASYIASPQAFVWEPWLDRLLSAADPATLLSHLRVLRWTLDELPMPARLFEEIVEWLYRQDRFYRGQLLLDHRRVSPASIQAPILCVLDEQSPIISAAATRVFLKQTHSPCVRILPRPYEVGVAVQHVGVFVGKTSHQTLWPQILRWINSEQ